MAQWSRADKTLYAKLVYYGPAMGGKTTNLRSLHRITDPNSERELLSVNTTDDRTLFFDLLPFDLGSILGYKVALKVFTVPGQVKYDVTRRVVLAGADAVVFVADSRRDKEKENRASLDNLRINMKANRLDPATVPILLQFNKQDLREAAPPSEVASWLGAEAAQGFPAVALRGDGVLETFMAAAQAMLQRLVALADGRTARDLRAGDLAKQVEKAFAPHLARQKASAAKAEPASPGTAPPPIVVGGGDLLEQSVNTSLRLGADLAEEKDRSSRLEREAESFRKLSEALLAVGAQFDADAIVDRAVDVAGRILGAAAVSLIRRGPSGEPIAERTWRSVEDPLLGLPDGKQMVTRMMEAGGPLVVDDLASELRVGSATLARFRAVAAVPVEKTGSRTLLAYAAAPDGQVREADIRFLATIAAHLAVGFDKARTHTELERHRDRLEELVHERTKALQKAYEDLRSLEQVKDRFLSSLSHEMRTPLTAILGSASFLHDYEGTQDERKEMIEGVLHAAHTLERLIENLFRVVRLEGPGQRLELRPTSVSDLLSEALRLAGRADIPVEVKDGVESVRVDPERVARAVANLVDNAVKFSPPESATEIRVSGTMLKAGEKYVEAVAISVLDRGPGVAEQDVERIFAPFEQGGEILTSKPSGVGLGLHEARTIARLHGGSLRYFGRQGGGSEFRMILPMQSVQAEGFLEVAIA